MDIPERRCKNCVNWKVPTGKDQRVCVLAESKKGFVRTWVDKRDLHGTVFTPVNGAVMNFPNSSECQIFISFCGTIVPAYIRAPHYEIKARRGEKI